MTDHLHNIHLKRIYDAPSPGDGHRVLVERVWPRGVRKETAALNEWLQEIAPSKQLRQWYGHDPDRWPTFRWRYREELKSKERLLDHIREFQQEGPVTLVFAARDTERNSAVVLKELLAEENDAPS